MRRISVVLVGLSVATAVGAGPATAAIAPVPAWDWVSAASPGDDTGLLDVAQVGGRVWAVGNARPDPLVERWNGTAFVRVSISGLSNRDDVLEGVGGAAANDLWAVGHADRLDFVGSVSLTYHWNGVAWSRIPSPQAGDSESSNNLLAVAAVSSRDVWAVGQFVDVSTRRAVTMHWNGIAWRMVANGCGSGLNGVTALASNNVWAVGGNILCHWDGQRWTPQPAPQVSGRSTDLQDIDAASGAMWAVGEEFASCGDGQLCPSGIILRRTSTGWVREAEGYSLRGVTVLGAADAWAVGTWRYGPLLLHRDASSWRPVPTPDTPGIGSLQAVDAYGPDKLWAVGSQLLPPATEVLALQAPSTRSGAVDGRTGSLATVTWFGPESGSIGADQFGHFQVGGLTSGDYTFFASLPGCTPVSRQISITSGVTKTITLTPTC